MFGKTKRTQIVLSSMLVLISLLLCMKQIRAQTPGVGAGVPHIVVDPTPLNFGIVGLNQNATKILTVKNTGTAALFVVFDPSPNPPFSVESQGFKLLPNGQRTITVSFHPTAMAQYHDTLSIDHNDPDAATIVIALQGEGVVFPTLTVVNNLVHPDCHQLRLFNLEIDGNIVRADDNGGRTDPLSQSIGHHRVSVTGGTGTNIFEFFKVIGGDCDEHGNVTLASGDNKICTITNFDHLGGCKCSLPRPTFCTEPGFREQGCLQCSAGF